jgi:ABC-type nitrate/sulfonate/bicarbonate transport system substrate-binding protein
VALDAGYFEKHGLVVEPELLSGNASIQALVAGQVPVIQVGGATVAPAIVEGADLLVIAASIHRLPAQIYAVPVIESPQALRGKRLAITRGGTLTDFAARLALRQWELKPAEDVALLSLNDTPSILAGLLAGAADAGVLTDPHGFTASNQGLRLLADLADSPGEYLATGWATTTPYARQNRSLLLNFLRGYLEGTKRFYEDKPFAIETLRKYTQIDDLNVLEQTYRLYAEKYFVKVPFPTERGLQNILSDYAETNPKARDVAAAQALDGSFVEELRREGLLRSLGLE